MNKLFQLSVEDILNKQFHADLKGYNSLEVDEFLDLVMADYQTFHEKLKEASETMQKYENTIEALRLQIHEFETAGQPAEQRFITSGSNVDILKRLSRLEAEVFKR